jgi:hypothetical protein
MNGARRACLALAGCAVVMLCTSCGSHETPSAWDMQAPLEAVDGSVWVVGEHLVRVAPDAQLSGRPVVGATVHVSGSRTDTGELSADRVEVVARRR